MKTYRAMVRVRNPARDRVLTIWAQVSATSITHARQLLEAQYGQGSVLGVVVVAV